MHDNWISNFFRPPSSPKPLDYPWNPLPCMGSSSRSNTHPCQTCCLLMLPPTHFLRPHPRPPHTHQCLSLFLLSPSKLQSITTIATNSSAHTFALDNHEKKLQHLFHKHIDPMESTPLPSLPDKLSSYLKCRAIDPRAVHGLSLKLGCLCSTFLSNNLLHAYVSRSMLVHARKLFDVTPQRNVVTWSAMISGYTQMGNLKDAIFLLREMLGSRVPENEDKDGLLPNKFMNKDVDILLPNKFTFGSIVTGCARANDLRTGVQIHCEIVKFGVESDTFVAGALIDMYSKCGKVKESWNVFDQTPKKDVVSWTTMITSLANSGQHQLWDYAFKLFKDMICRGIRPVGMTFASLVKIFNEPMKLRQAKQAHGCMVKLGIEVDDLLGSALIAMYGRCGGMDEAVRLSDRINHDVVSQTSMLVAYMQNGFNVEAIDAFCKMIEEKYMIDAFVFASVIGACSVLEELGMGKEIHCHALRKGFTSDVSVCNALITLYGRCGEIRKAERVFQLMGDKDMISWTAILTCYSQNGRGEEALLLFRQMLQGGLSPPIFSITSALRVCSMTASLSTGQQIHSRIVKMGIVDSLSVENSLITMYAKCGSIEVAKRVFNFMTNRDIVSWNALITGFSQHGYETEALELFNQMQEEGVQPNDYTFTGLLVSCSRVGLIAEGCSYFKLMSSDYGLEPIMEHYACMVDLFGRAGRLNDAMEFIDAMPCEPDQLVWEALLASCKVHGNVDLAKFAAKKIMQMRPEDPSPYIILSGIHALMGVWDTKAHFRAMMKDQGLQKEPGRSWIEAQECSEDIFDILQVGGI